MKIEKSTVEHVANLARLNLTESEIESLGDDLSNVIEFANKLNELDIKDVEPTAHVLDMHNVFRSDEVKPSMDREELLKNAPSKMQGCFYVPKVVE